MKRIYKAFFSIAVAFAVMLAMLPMAAETSYAADSHKVTIRAYDALAGEVMTSEAASGAVSWMLTYKDSYGSSHTAASPQAVFWVDEGAEYEFSGSLVSGSTYTFKGWKEGDPEAEDYIGSASSLIKRAMGTSDVTFYAVVEPATIVPDEPIKTIDIGTIWTTLDPVNIVPFTAEVHDEDDDSDGINFNDKMEIFDEAWVGDHIINKRDGSGILKVGETYKYEITLKAKSGWKFEEDFKFIYGGHEMTVYEKDISEEGTKIRLWDFIDPVTVKAVNISNATVTGIANKTYNGKAQTQNPVVKINANGTAVTLKKGTDYTVGYKNNTNAGTKATVTITGKGNYSGSISKTFTIKKAANPLKPSAKTASIKYSKLKKTSQTIAVTKVIKFTNDIKDKKNYTLSSAKKGKQSFIKYFTVNKKTGKVTVKKGLKKGIYKVKVKVSAAGNANYKASGTKTVTFTVKVI